MTLKTWTEAVRDWLPLVETSGVYLAPKVLDEAFPQSLDPVETAVRQRARRAWEEWRDAVDDGDPRLPDLHREWVNFVLGELLEYGGGLLRPGGEGAQVGSGDAARPDWLLGHEGDAPKVAVFVLPPERSPDRAAKKAFSLLEQATAWCRAAGIRSALLTDGEQWTLLDAPEGAVSGHVTWHARLWWLEPVTLRAFFTFLNARTVFGTPERTFPALVDRSLEFKDEVTTTLGTQVERAVEVLVRALDRADRDKRGTLLRGVSERELYEAGLTVMMRLVFVLSAEERGLLLLGEPVWDGYYAVSTLRAQLEETDDRDGHGVLERRYDAWSRLLAVFRAVYGGVDHETLRLPALGGSLFDPDRFPFLEGRAVGTTWRDTPAEPLPIDNRTVLLLLDALQRIKGKDGAQTLSYRALDVEQIGHVYEGLLERTVSRVPDITLGLDGTGKSKTPDVLLADLESARLDGRERLLDVVAGLTARTTSSSKISLGRMLDREVSDNLRRRLRRASGSDDLSQRILPFANLLRTDPWDEPVVYPQHAFAVISGSDRSTTGAHYTPKVLTERIVGTTLEPLAYVGPAEGLPREEWLLKSAAELLNLRVCDPAMGSGAFLVQVCRWLADRVVLAWATAEADGKAVTTEGDAVSELSGAEAMTTDPEDRLLQARRLVAERCLYGVDINPVAVELAKLSIWLVTLAKNRPFGFLDHNLRHGDSLLGIHDLDQLTELSMTPAHGAQQRIFSMNIREAVDRAVTLRTRLRAMPIRDIRDVEAMARLDLEARTVLRRPELAADALIGEAMRHAGSTGNLSAALTTLSSEVGKMMDGDADGEQALTKRADAALAVDLPDGSNPREPFHWPLEFPEVFHQEHGGFDAFVGNPPFLGGVLISKIYGDAYNQHLSDIFNTGKKVDLSAFFLRRVFSLTLHRGAIGLITTNSISQGTTRRGGLEHILENGGKIVSASKSLKWPGNASVIVSIIELIVGEWNGLHFLDDSLVEGINSELIESNVDLKIENLNINRNLCFQGSNFYGKGFFVETSVAEEMILADQRNSTVVIPVMGGAEINRMIEFTIERYAINFFEMDFNEANSFPIPFEYISERVKPERELLNGVKYPRLVDTWWKYWHSRLKLYQGISEKAINRVIARSRVSDHHMIDFLPTGLVYTDALIVYLFDTLFDFGVLQSSVHDIWSRKHSSTMKSDVRYVVSDCFETFVRPPYTDTVERCAHKYYEIRLNLKKESNIGMTQIYNRFHNPSESYQEFRDAHQALDRAVLDSYGWIDILPKYDFRSSSQGLRFSMDEISRDEIIKRLSDLNIIQYDSERSLEALPVKTKIEHVKQESLYFHPLDTLSRSMQEHISRSVLSVLRSSRRWFGKTELLEASGIPSGSWKAAVDNLLESGEIEKAGEKRGTRYRSKT